MAPKKMKAKGIYRGVLKQEKRMAKKEVKKAKKMVHKKKKWTVAASAMGYHAGYSSQHGIMFGKGGLSSKMVQPPAQVMAVPATSSTLFKTYYTRKEIKNGLIVCGQQKLANIASDGNANANAFTVGGTRTASIYLSPDSIGGQMATDARNYQFYKFKKLRIICVMSAPTTDSLNVGLMFSADPQIASYQTLTYETIQQATDFVSFTRKQPNGPVVWHLTELKKSQYSKYNTELDTTNDISKRNSIQGIFYGFFDANDSANTKYGDLLVEYELALFNRTPDYGFTMSIGDQKLGAAVCNTIEKYAIDVTKDCKSDEDIREIKMHLMKSYPVAMRQLKNWSGLTPRAGEPNGFPALVAIANSASSVYTLTRGTDAATVTGGALSTGGGSAAQIVDIQKVGGWTVSSDGSGRMNVGANLYRVGDTAINSTGTGNIPVDVQTVTTTAIQNSAIPIDTKRVNGTAVATASIPVNIDRINAATLINTANPSNSGIAMNAALPIQVWGFNSGGGVNAATLGQIGGTTGTSALVTPAVMAYSTSSATSDSKMCEIPSPTESLDSVVVMKMPKDKFKQAIKDAKEIRKDTTPKQKGPPGPSVSMDMVTSSIN